MTRLFLIILILLLTSPALVVGQNVPPRDKCMEPISQEQYDRQLEQFIVQDAMLTPQEAADFFPVFEEMRQKQRVIYDELKRKGREYPISDEDCEEAIRDRDRLEIELKEIQQTYHNKFLSLLPASKVIRILNAEDRFHRDMLKGCGKDKNR